MPITRRQSGKQTQQPSTSAVDEPDEYHDNPEEDDDRQDDSESDEYSDEPGAKRRKTAKGKSVTTKARSSTKPKGKRVTKSKKPAASTKRKGRGSLKNTPELPMDILYEIFSHMEPGGLLNFARTTKKIRSILMSSDSSFIWRAARKNVTGTPAPDPPDDMSEPAWANLLYTPQKQCFECVRTNIEYIDFAFRRRLCLPCRKDEENPRLLRLKGNKQISDYGFEARLADLSETAGAAPPCLFGFPISKPCRPTLLSFHAVNMTSSEKINLSKLKPSWTDLLSWVNGKGDEKYAIDETKKAERYNDIVDRLIAAGYSRDEVVFGNSLRNQPGVESVRPLTDAAWEQLAPKLTELLNAARVQRVEDQRKDKIKSAYNAFLQTIVPIQRFFLPRELSPSPLFMSFRTLQAPELPCVQQLIDLDPVTEMPQEQFERLIATSFFVDTSAWALNRMKFIKEVASLSMTFPPSVVWVTLDTPPVERDRRLAELGKLPFPSLGPTPRLPDKELFIGRDAMNMGKPNGIMVFSARGAEAVRAVLALEHLDSASTMATELDARSTLFRCTHCSAPEEDFIGWSPYQVEHFILKEDHPQPSWSLVPAVKAVSLQPDGHSIESPQEVKDLFHLPSPEECAPRLLSMFPAA
ncbi:hypothetical protein C8R44DRAFT_986255 [Mycena epipterygia]|nr:hypothetical protein C8R44DRAFT_986255 [Mycena epipterygia]